MTHRTPRTDTRRPLAGETLITLADACRGLPGRFGAGRQLTLGAMLRRINKGTRSRTTGKLVKLEAFREGGRWLTSEEALARYYAALDDRPATASTRDFRSRAESRRAAAAQLDAAGI